jgi:hypothetical protein
MQQVEIFLDLNREHYECILDSHTFVDSAPRTPILSRSAPQMAARPPSTPEWLVKALNTPPTPSMKLNTHFFTKESLVEAVARVARHPVLSFSSLSRADCG